MRLPCPVCGASMEGRRKNAVYCSGGCRTRAAEERQQLSDTAPDARPFWRGIRGYRRRPREA